MKICILEAGLTPASLLPLHGSAPSMIERWLKADLPEAVFETVSVVRGEALPAPDRFDGYVITGSPHGVYENLPWMILLKEFLSEVRKARRPLVGICFGHQVMAEAFGGRVEKSARGWGIGVQTYRMRAGRSNVGHLLPESGSFLVFHQDQVVDVPASARVIGGSDFCPVGLLEYEFPAVSMQFHPEFTQSFVNALLKDAEEGSVPSDVAEAALANLNSVLANDHAAHWVSNFLRSGVAVTDADADLAYPSSGAGLGTG